MKMKSLLFLILLGLMYAPVTMAQDEEEDEKTFDISGSVDVYAHSSLGYDTWAPGTSFSNLKGFSLGMANIIASYEGNDAGFVADLVFGPRGEDAVFGSPFYALSKTNPFNASSQMVNQLYVYWKPTDGLKLTLGNFNTFLGYEVISPTVNVNYSTSYMFSYGPFSHTGLKADIGLSDNLSLALAIMNPTDVTELNPVSTYTLGAQLGYTSDAGGAWLNILYGDQDGTYENDGPSFADTSLGAVFQVDLTAGFDISDAFYIGLNGTYRTMGAGEDGAGDIDGDPFDFMGFAIYPKLTLSESMALGFRAEYFAYTNFLLDGLASTANTDGDGSIIDFTASLNYKVGNLTFIPEVRIDIASEDSYGDKDGNGTTTLPSLTLAAVYAF